MSGFIKKKSQLNDFNNYKIKEYENCSNCVCNIELFLIVNNNFFFFVIFT